MTAEISEDEMASRLAAVKLLHTVVWAFFAGCIVAIPALAWTHRYRAAAWLIGIVAVEAIIVLVNGWKCPLTAVAARYTSDRRDNFDIFLPVWIARYNKLVFGALYICGATLTAYLWVRRHS